MPPRHLTVAAGQGGPGVASRVRVCDSREMSRLSWFLCGLLLLSAAGCSSSSPSSPTVSNLPRADFTQTDVRVGTGTAASNGRSLSVNYTGWIYDPTRPEQKGTQFESGSYTLTLGTGSVIRGWDLGLVGMRVGGLRRLTIPPDLAYGSRGSGPIPPNASLVFDIELLNVQ